MNEIIIFGRSPFLHHVRIDSLIEHYPSMGFNHFANLHPVDYVFYFDSMCSPKSTQTLVFVPYLFDKAPAEYIRYRHIESDTPILKNYVKNGVWQLGRRYFTTSIGINWAMLNGFKKLYLVGVDHIESNTRFEHHDGEPCYSELTSASHTRFKQFVYECARHVEIYQTNPAVKEQWDLPFKPLEDLYHGPQAA